MKRYVHKKTGKAYELVQDHLLCKTKIHTERVYCPDSFDDYDINTYEWDKILDKQIVLYRALYDNPDGPYFVRYADDFYKEFEEYVAPKKEYECADCLRFFNCSYIDAGFKMENAEDCGEFDCDERLNYTR